MSTSDSHDKETDRAGEETGPVCDRRAAIIAGGKAAAAGVAAVVASSFGQANAAESRVGQECMTILYENGDDVRFDFDYYEKTHMPLIMSRYGDSISRFELRRGQPGADGSPPRFIATISIWIADGEAFDAAAAEHQAALRADVPKFTNAPLYAQRDRIVGITDS
jgi:uncharacterized protein (TIGR02118 family)